jgi:hypothetical protein
MNFLQVESYLGLFILPGFDGRNRMAHCYLLEDIIAIISEKQCEVCNEKIRPSHLKIVSKWVSKKETERINVCSVDCEMAIYEENELILRPKSRRNRWRLYRQIYAGKLWDFH